MSYSKHFITFKNKILHFDDDIELAGILYSIIRKNPISEDADKLFSSQSQEKHPRVCFKTSILPNHSPQKGKYQEENRKISPVFQAFQAQ